LKEVDKDIIKQLRINQMIRAQEVRLVGEKGEQLGVMPLSQAQETARKHYLDLVEVAPAAVPPVCRLLDYGKYKYQQAKKEQEMRKSQRISLLREVRLRPKIGTHDFEAKSRTARKLLADGNKVKVTVLFRGREITHPELGFKLLQRMTETLNENASIDRQPVIEGKRMNLILIPVTKAKAKEEIKESQDAKDENT
jgi:translation initiation factor IF-3